MNRLKIGFISVVLVLGMAGAARAMTLTDVTEFSAAGTSEAQDYVSHGWGDVNFLSPMNEEPLRFDYVAWEHEFTFDSYVLQIQSGTLKIFLRNNVNSVASFRSGPPTQFAFGWIGGESSYSYWDIGEVDNGIYTSDVNVGYLADGVLEVKISAAGIGGDFYIDKSELTIDYDLKSVPEPATMLLLGLGLIGVAGMRKKFKK